MEHIDREDALNKADTIASLRYCLLLMVYQYCERDGIMNSDYISAGENAFTALGINDGDSAESVWKKIEEAESKWRYPKFY